MTRSYWSQWDKADLDSWQGKDYPGHDDEDFEQDSDDSNPDLESEEEEGCPCGYYCFDCLGMSWRDFM